MVKNTEAMITTFDLTRPRFWGKTSGALEEKAPVGALKYSSLAVHTMG
jgi:hypothetical protein